MRIIVTGLIAQHPTLGGVTWDYLQYVIGLQKLGHEVYYFEDSGQWPYTVDGGSTGDQWIAYDPVSNIEYLNSVMKRYGLQDRWAYRYPIKPRWYGLTHQKRREIIETAELLINVSGTLRRPADYRQIPKLAYIDSDPVFTQVKLNLKRGQLKFKKRLAAHDIFFSFGECLSYPVPDTEYQWIPTRTPIVLSEWRPSQEYRNVFTTVMSWTSYPPLRFARKRYAQKDVEFGRFLDLPQRVESIKFEVALGNVQHLEWCSDAKGAPDKLECAKQNVNWSPSDTLRALGWKVVDPAIHCSDLDGYRSYVESSKAEWSVAKNGYVVGQSGWFSCRSACYLAAGRPVVVQETGFSNVLPSGEGVIGFTKMDEAVRGVREIEGNYEQHSKAARLIAEEYFDSDKVLSRLMEQAMNGGSKSGNLRKDF
jgi:hypothetical protein